MRREKATPDQKLQAVREVLAKKHTLRQVAKQYGLHHSSVEKWVTLYRTFGEDAFDREQNTYYSNELKQKAVETYLTTNASLQGICREYKLRSITQVQQWVKAAEKQISSRSDHRVSGF